MLRRDTLKLIASGTLILVSGLLKPITALAKWNKEAFTARDLQTAMDAYFPDQEITETERIKIGVHAVVENGAVVPIKIETDLPKLESITIFVEKNPNPLISNFDLSPACLGFVSTRIKVDQASTIVIVVKADGKAFKNSTYIEVQEGGCA